MGNDPALAHARTDFQITTSKQGSKTRAQEQRTQKIKHATRKNAKRHCGASRRRATPGKKRPCKRRQSAPRRNIRYPEQTVVIFLEKPQLSPSPSPPHPPDKPKNKESQAADTPKLKQQEKTCAEQPVEFKMLAKANEKRRSYQKAMY